MLTYILRLEFDSKKKKAKMYWKIDILAIWKKKIDESTVKS